MSNPDQDLRPGHGRLEVNVSNFIEAASFTFLVIPVDWNLTSFVELTEVCETGDLNRAMRRDPSIKAVLDVMPDKTSEFREVISYSLLKI